MKEIIEIDGTLFKVSAIEKVSPIHDVYMMAGRYKKGFKVCFHEHCTYMYIREGEGYLQHETPNYTEHEEFTLRDKYESLTRAIKDFYNKPTETVGNLLTKEDIGRIITCIGNTSRRSSNEEYLEALEILTKKLRKLIK